MAKILVTGSEGFIGSHLFEKLSLLGHDVCGVDLVSGSDLCDLRLVNNLDSDFDFVFHFAAFNGTKKFYEQPFECAWNNTIPTLALVKKFKDTACRFVFASTCEIFNGAVQSFDYPVPTDEAVPVVFSDIENPRWSYSVPKALGENVVSNSIANYVNLRLFNVYGPRQKDHFVDEFVRRGLAEGRWEIYGNDTRSFCFINDAIDHISKIALDSNFRGVCNIGSEDEVRIEEVAKAIMMILNISPDLLKVFPSPEGSVPRRCPDITLLRTLIKTPKQTNLVVGLEKTLGHFL